MKQKIIEKLKPCYHRLKYEDKEDFDRPSLRHFKNCQRILDVGCGDGRFLKKDPQRIIGLDNNERVISFCRGNGWNIIEADVTKPLPLENSSVDGIHCSHLIEHLYPDQVFRLLCEFDRILQTNGILIIIAPTLSQVFYSDLDHIKPYHPEALFPYLLKEGHTTLPHVKGQYEFISLEYGYLPLGPLSAHSSWAFLMPIFNFLHRFGVHSFKKVYYSLVLKKIEN